MITHRGPYDACTGVQLLITALLGQIYGALSKVSSLRSLMVSSLPTLVHRIEESAQPVKSSVRLASSGQDTAECWTVHHSP